MFGHFDSLRQLGFIYAQHGRHFVVLARHVGNALAFPIPVQGNVVIERHKFRLLPQQLAQFVQCPHIELAFFAFAVRILATVKAAAGVAHFFENVVACFNGNALVKRVGRGLPAVQVNPRQLGVVIQHLLKVGY